MNSRPIDPFYVKRWSKADPRRLGYVVWSRGQEWWARQLFDKTAIPTTTPTNAELPVFTCEDTSVTPEQARELLRALRATEPLNRPVVEVGCYRGVTTELLARHTSRDVFAVDPFAGYGGAAEEYVRFQDRTKGKSNITHLRLTSGAAALDRRLAQCSLVFIDAVHDYVNTRFDGLVWGSKLCVGGMLAFHDTDQRCFAGTRRFVSELSRKPDFRLFAHVDNVTIFQRVT